MKHFLLFSLLTFSLHTASAYEYKLQFTPPGGAQHLNVAGYTIASSAVGGNCSYDTVSVGSGRGAHSTTTHHYNSCTWDLFGNLTSLTPLASAPVVPPVLSTSGTEVLYASSGSSTTGRDTRGFGFVTTPSPHYSWQTVNGGYAVIPYSVYTVTVTLVSDGDLPLVVDSSQVASVISGYITPSPGTATIASTTCGNSVAVGATCTVTVSYDPTTIQCTGDAYGYAYTQINLSLVTNAGATVNWKEGFTIIGVPMCDD